MAKFFKKDLLSNLVHNRLGRRIEWEPLAENTGVLQLNEETQNDLIVDLETMIARTRGGVSVISREQYEDLKKKLPLLPSASPSETLKVAGSAHQAPRNINLNAVVGSLAPAPIVPEVPVPVVPKPANDPVPPSKPFNARLGKAKKPSTPSNPPTP